jgi:uncharacterized membrane protein
MFPRFEAELTEEGPLLRLRTRPAHWLRRGAVLGLVVPALLAMVLVLLIIVDLIDRLRLGDGTIIGVALFVLVGGPSALWGAVMALGAQGRSRRSVVEVDLAGGVVRPTGAPARPLSAVRALRLHKPNSLLAWLAVDALLVDDQVRPVGPYQAPGLTLPLRLWGDIPEQRGAEALALAGQLAERLGVPVEDGRGAFDRGLDAGKRGRSWHTAAYVPMQGIFLFASALILLTRKDDAVGRFHARQSLSLLVVESVAIVGVVIVGAPLMFLPGGRDPHPVGVAVLVGGLLIVTMARLVLRFYAAWRAWRGDLWLLPVLGRLTRRWLPPAE